MRRWDESHCRHVIVDAHVHLFSPLSERHPRDISDLFPAEAMATAQELRTTMTRAGVDRAVVVALSPHDEFLTECLAAHGDAFVGIGVFGGGGPDDIARRRQAGLRGLRVFRLGEGEAAGSGGTASMTALAAMADLGMLLSLYVAADQVPMIAGVARALPRLQIVLNHLGFPRSGTSIGRDGLPHADVVVPPPTLPAVLDLARYPNVSVMVSGEYAFGCQVYPFSDVSAVVRALHTHFGSPRMLWASDHPWAGRHLGYERLMELPRHHLPHASSEELEWLMGGTAARLLGLD
jgi:L-fuconolactonase